MNSNKYEILIIDSKEYLDKIDLQKRNTVKPLNCSKISSIEDIATILKGLNLTINLKYAEDNNLLHLIDDINTDVASDIPQRDCD